MKKLWSKQNRATKMEGVAKKIRRLLKFAAVRIFFYQHYSCFVFFPAGLFRTPAIVWLRNFATVRNFLALRIFVACEFYFETPN